ncbi:hypothetical protein NUW54_g7490 [Trametes sanguinea]|uniref:Uncharacterized protein n=1 Tax=Trametes sanguinea TaxID=158606 RepID=A0ACC1PK33_9APHY|nr:hypothetical protein NUW54_g7490 [Trametes sanguinea]
MRLLFCPLPGRYVAVRLDPVAMVKHLRDPVALREAQAMRPKTYLMYIETDLELPYPGRPWYKFSMSPIGTTLRFEDKEHGFTKRMCIPIYPNERHPSRAPLIPEQEFPYNNCYHWFDFRVFVRIRASSRRFEDHDAIWLHYEQERRMARCWLRDRDRARRNRQTRFSEPDCPICAFAGYDRGGVTLAPTNRFGDVFGHRHILNEYAHDVELFPIVDVWHEFPDFLRQRDIPNPLGFFKERDHIAQ